MNKINVSTNFIKNLLLTTLAGVLVVACEKEEDSHEDIVKADLLIIIHSLDSPCEEVLEYESTDELGYVVNCQSGHEYLISVNPQGRVGVQNRE